MAVDFSPHPNPPPQGGRGKGGELSPLKAEGSTVVEPSPLEGEGGTQANRPGRVRGYGASTQGRARQLCRSQTPPEKQLWDRVRSSQLGFKIRRQQPIGPYIVDFLCSEVGLVIELDGDSHASAVTYDQVRTLYLQERGYQVLRVTNVDVQNNLESVLSAISQRIQRSSVGALESEAR